MSDITPPVRELTAEEIFWNQPKELQTGILVISNGFSYTYDKGVLQGQATSPAGDKIHFVDDEFLSSIDSPTIEHVNGDKSFYVNDILVKYVKSDGTILTGNQIV
jgi:hypothetical protein